MITCEYSLVLFATNTCKILCNFFLKPFHILSAKQIHTSTMHNNGGQSTTNYRQTQILCSLDTNITYHLLFQTQARQRASPLSQTYHNTPLPCRGLTRPETKRTWLYQQKKTPCYTPKNIRQKYVRGRFWFSIDQELTQSFARESGHEVESGGI